MSKETKITTKNSNLHDAKKNKNDEFYTQLVDIENELRHYKDHFQGKIVFCNCDDPYESNFFQYFALNFKYLWLKKLIAMGYNTSPITNTQLSLLDVEDIEEPKKKAYKIEIFDVVDENHDGALNMVDIKLLARKNKDKIKIRTLRGDGDFRSNESINSLLEADIVVTNPPFSLFREYIAQLMFYEKKFLIIGNHNAITYKEIFPLLKDDKMWLGSMPSFAAFQVPEHYEEKSNRFWVDENGQKWRSFGNIAWYTNLDHARRHEDIILYKKYTPDEYPKYDNYDAVEVSRVEKIPKDYTWAMGVPITFLGKHNPEQFEILWCSYQYGEPIWYHYDWKGFWVSVNWLNVYKRLFIKNKKPQP